MTGVVNEEIRLASHLYNATFSLNVPDKIKDRMKTRIVLIKSYNLAKKPCLYPLITATINTNKIQKSTI
jgi:hypothetical protein